MCRWTAVLLAALIATSPAVSAEFRVGGLAPPGTAADIYWQTFNTNVIERSDGALQPVLLTKGEAGSDEEIFASLRRNRIQISQNGSLAISAVAPEFAVLGAPYFFDSEAEVDYVLREHVKPMVADLLSEKGITLIQLLPMGWLNFYGQKPYVEPVDVKDLRLRMPKDRASELFGDALGLDQIPLASVDVVQSLQTGLIQGGSTVTLAYFWTGLSEQAKVLTLSKHAFLVNATMANKQWWESLDSDERDIVSNAFPTEAEFAVMMRAAVAAELAKAEEHGVDVNEFDAAGRSAWRAIGRETHAPLVDSIGGQAQALFDRMEEGKAAFALRTKGGDLN